MNESKVSLKENKRFPLNKYPFFDYSEVILQDMAISIQRLDDTNVFDSMIKDAINDIIYSFIHKRLNPKIDSNIHAEVGKFYITMFILRSMPSKLMAKYWIKAYIERLESIINQDLAKNIPSYYFSEFFNELGLKHKFVRVDSYEWMIIKINDYFTFSIEIEANDTPEYKRLLPQNMGVQKGRVFINVNDINSFTLIVLKLCKRRIEDLLFKSHASNSVKSDKIEKCVKQLQTYLVDHKGLYNSNDNTANIRRQEYGEVTPDLEIKHDQILEELFTDKQPDTEINVKSFPPCVNRIISKLFDKKDALNHRENIHLASYLSSKGFSKDQMIQIFRMAINYDAQKVSYNLDYVLDKKLKPFNCEKADSYYLCYPDEICKKYHIKNPMNYAKE